MHGDVSIALVGGLFFSSVLTLVGVSLFVLTVFLKKRAALQKRLNRVGRRRLSGKIDIEEVRLSLAKKSQDTGALFNLTDALSKFIPILDTARLKRNFVRAGMGMTVAGFLVSSLVLAAVLTFAGVMITDYPAAILVLPAILLGMLLMDLFVKMRGERASSKFMAQLPDALDTIIRGIRSGLPVIECVGTVGEEFDEPIGSKFRAISERVKLGAPLDVSLWEVAKIVDRPEMDFLAVCISIQMETGGSLAEALANLSDLLRKRQQMKLKIKAISSEAKASALIIGLLPFVMLGLLSIMSPDYVAPLFVDPRGHMMLGGGFASISIGAFIMWRMTKFEI